MKTFYLQDGAISVFVYKNNAELTKAMKKMMPELKKHKVLYGNYIPKVNYTSIGELHISKETSLGVIAHEIYHAVQHKKRMNLFLNPTGKQSWHQDAKEEREAAMFGFLFNQVLEELK